MPTGPEIPAYILVPEHWDGHIPRVDGECPQTYHPNQGYIYTPSWGGSWKGVFRMTRYLGQHNKFAKEILESYLALADKTVEKSLNPGQTFDGANYPLGTLIRFDRETLGTEGSNGGAFGLKYPFYLEEAFYGILCQFEQCPDENRFLMTYWGDTRIVGSKVYQFGKAFQPKIVVGEVDHERAEIPGQWERFRRVNHLEVLQFGKGVPIKVREFKFFGRTVPSF